MRLLLRGHYKRSLRKRSYQRRSVVSRLVEPPLDSTVPERPCTVALVEDGGWISSSKHSWGDSLAKWLPNDHGVTFASLDLGISSTPNEELDLSSSLNALQMDFQELMTPQVILIARGPLVGWLALLHLESHSLAGLVLVDPLPLDDQDIVEYLENSELHDGDTSTLQQSISSWKSSRPLLLEPGAVPMMILKSRAEKVFERGAELTANRHRLMRTNERLEEYEGSFVPGDVPVLSLKDESLETSLQDFIIPWVKSQVL